MIVLQQYQVKFMSLGMQLNLLQNQIQTVIKVDRQFGNALYFLTSRNKKLMFAEAIKIAFLLTLLYSFAIQRIFTTTIIVLLILSLILSVFCVAILFYIKWKSQDITLNIQIASFLGHATQQPIRQNHNHLVFDQWISNTYNARNLQAAVSDIDQEKRLSKAIEQSYINQKTSHKVIINLVRHVLILISVWILLKILVSQFEQSGFSGYICTYVLFQFVILEDYNYIVGLIVFSPLICLFACIATGYSRYKEYQKELRVKLNIRVCDRSGVMNDCPICFAEFEEKEKVCELECPGKHIYHEDCIRTWIKVQKSCPTCRYNLVGDISN